MNTQTQTQEALLTGNWNHESVITPNTITFNRIKPNSEWVMRITPDRRIEVNVDVELTEIVQTVFAGIQDMLDKSQMYISQEQEPVDVARVQEDGSVEWNPDLPDFPVGTKLYTHPATWESLSDEEVNKIADKCYILQTSVSDYEFNEFEFARAIEQALKEKNYV